MPSCKWPIQTFSISFGTCICLREWGIICCNFMENCVPWFLIWSSLNVKHKLSSTDILQLKSHIGKPFTTREGVKQMKDVKKCVNNPPCFRGTQQWFPPQYIENTFKAIQSTFRSPEMHFKRRYKICICSVILGELESFRNCKGLSIIFPKILDEILCITKVRFSYSSCHHIFESENFLLPFFYEK